MSMLPGGSRAHPGMFSGDLRDPVPACELGVGGHDHMGTSTPTPILATTKHDCCSYAVDWRAWPSVPWFLGSQSWELKGFLPSPTSASLL